MKISKPLQIEPETKAIKRFNTWFSKKQAEGLKYVHITLDIENNMYSNDKWWYIILPKYLKNKYVSYYLDKVLNNFVDIAETIDDGNISEILDVPKPKGEVNPKMKKILREDVF